MTQPISQAAIANSTDAPYGPVLNGPTPEEIAERCREIQAGWTEDEKLRRYNGRSLKSNPTDVPRIIRMDASRRRRFERDGRSGRDAE